MSFESIKAPAQAALITQARSGCVCFWEENLIPKKITRNHTYNQNGYDTRPCDRRSTLVDKQINIKSDAMWLYTSCKPHKNWIIWDHSFILAFIEPQKSTMIIKGTVAPTHSLNKYSNTHAGHDAV